MTSPLIPEVFAAAGLPIGLLPDRECRPGDRVARILPAVAKPWGFTANVQVVTGGLDSFLASVGSGIHEPGDACLNSGSNSVVALLARNSGAARFTWRGFPLLSRPTWVGGRILQSAGTLACGNDSFAETLLQAASLRAPLAIHHLLADFLDQRQPKNGEIRARLAEYLQSYSAIEVFRLLLDAIFLAQRMVLDDLEQQSERAAHLFRRRTGGIPRSESATSRRPRKNDRSSADHRQRSIGGRHAGRHGIGVWECGAGGLDRREAMPRLPSARESIRPLTKACGPSIATRPRIGQVNSVQRYRTITF